MLENKNQLNFQTDNLTNQSSFFKLSALMLIIFLCLLLMELFISGYSALVGLDYQETLKSLDENSPIESRNFIRTCALFNQLFTFLVPAIIFSYFFYKRKWISSLSINISPKVFNVLLGVLLILSSFPLVQFSLWLNQRIPLPQSLIDFENMTAGFITNMLRTEEPYELFFNLFVIAVLPALGEEFIFRGILQKKLMNRISNPHVAIWIVAIIFSAIHMQFQGFLPRVVLGGILGYLFYWTGNLWVPILVHFVNNAFQILGAYFYPEEMLKANLNEEITIDWGFTILSMVCVLFFSYLIRKRNLIKEPPISV